MSRTDLSEPLLTCLQLAARLNVRPGTIRAWTSRRRRTQLPQCKIEGLKILDLMNLSAVENHSPEEIGEDWRQARAFLREALADGPLTEAELFQCAERLGIRESSLWGVLTNLPPCEVLREEHAGTREPCRIWALLSREQL